MELSLVILNGLFDIFIYMFDKYFYYILFEVEILILFVYFLRYRNEYNVGKKGNVFVLLIIVLFF